MTTIAYKDGIMACDSCWTYSDTQVVSASKITRLSSGALLGQAGDNDARELESLLDKVKTARQLPLRSALAQVAVSFAGLLVLPNGQTFMVSCRENPKDFDDEVGIWECNRGFAACGSGSDLAIGAMEAGKSAPESVRIACKFDINSRLPVHTVPLKAAPVRKR